jgi:anti-sigma B factor antagonist
VIDDEKEVPMELTLDSRTEGPFQIVAVGGEIDVYTAPRLREAIVAAIDAGHTRLVVDVEKVEFLDSTGLGVLVGALKKVRADGGTLDIVCTQERILKIFDITGLDKVFGLHDSVSAAIAAHD